MTDERPQFEVYRVGILATVFDVWHAVRARRWKMARLMLRQARQAWRRAFKERNWRALRQQFHGYHAEISYPGLLRHTRCGRGWTRRGALSSLGRRLAVDNPPVH